MTEPVAQRGRSRRRHSEQFKREVVHKSVQPGISLASVAREHGVHPNLLSRWVKERTGTSGKCLLSVALPRPKFVPVQVEPMRGTNQVEQAPSAEKVEVNIDRDDLRIRFKVDASQMCELGQVLREVLR